MSSLLRKPLSNQLAPTAAITKGTNTAPLLLKLHYYDFLDMNGHVVTTMVRDRAKLWFHENQGGRMGITSLLLFSLAGKSKTKLCWISATALLQGLLPPQAGGHKKGWCWTQGYFLSLFLH